MASISPDVVQLDVLFDTFITKLLLAAAADTALQGAVSNVVAIRNDCVTKQQEARVAYNDFLRRIGTTSMNAAQRQAFRRIFGDVDDLTPGELGGAVKRLLEGF